MKIYTKSGDKGKTSLLSGKRVAKNHLRLSAYGEADQLNSTIGILCSYCENQNETKEFCGDLRQIQNKTFDLGSLLASDQETWKKFGLKKIESNDILLLEKKIDEMDKELPKLSNFILPGGGIASSYAHLARTTTRKVEREMISLIEAGFEDDVEENMIIWINRLSDYFFVLARFLCLKTKNKEVIWGEAKD